MSTVTFSGVYTALVTPFTSTGEVDYEAFQLLIKRQIAANVSGIVPCGTTGESPTLTKEEKKKLISFACSLVHGSSVQVIAGTGSNNTSESVDLTLYAKEVGAHACLIVNPYYNRPSQAGLIAHVKEIAKVGLPIVLYNIPGRSGVNMTVDTVIKLAKSEPMVQAIKDATGGVDSASELAYLCPELTVLSGDDGLTLPFMSVGAKGVISVVSNVAPKPLVKMVQYALQNDFSKARVIHQKLLPFVKSLFIETNPTPAKHALKVLSLITSDAVRLPLVNIQEGNKNTVEGEIKTALQQFSVSNFDAYVE
jgi:4-hydroxy-tetrahydrodipicolinate synthase